MRFTDIILCVASQREFIVVYFVMTQSGNFWIRSRLCWSSKQSLPPFRFSNENFVAFLISATRVRCPSHVILLDLISLTLFGEEYNL
jgi:hypothetical protein